MNKRNVPERKTFIQERFEILIKKQKNGDASFLELTELDEIVNKNASIREQILDELAGNNNSSDDVMGPEFKNAKVTNSFLAAVKLFFERLFISGHFFQKPVLF